jgi:uncharacterized membrane protein
MILGIILVILGVPLALSKVRPNSIYGFRVQKTLADPAVWYKVNAFLGKGVVICGIAMIVLSLTAPMLTRLLDMTAGNYGLAVILSPLAIVIALTWNYMSRLTR